VDFHQRKKRGAEVPPSELPLNWYGVDKIVRVIPSLIGDWMAETGQFSSIGGEDFPLHVMLLMIL
jgi:hypothetical protein